MFKTSARHAHLLNPSQGEVFISTSFRRTG